MNVSRFYSVLELIKEDFRRLKIIKWMEEIESQLDISVNNPAGYDPHDFEQSYITLKKALTECKSNSVSISMKSIISELGISAYVGKGLLHTIDKVVMNRSSSQAEVLEKYKSILRQVTTYKKRISALINGMNVFGIEGDSIRPGECEVSLLIPPKSVGSSVNGLANDFTGFDKLFNFLSELVSQPVESPKIKSLNSSEYLVVLAALAPVGFALSKILRNLAAAHKDLVAAKKMQKEMDKMDVPENVTNQFSNFISKLVDRKLDDISKQLVDEFGADLDSGRKNELQVGIKDSLKFLAKRIDRGVRVEVTMMDPEKPKSVEGKKDTKQLKDHEELIQIAKRIHEDGNALSEIASGEKEIFYLPEESDESNDRETQ